MDETIKFLASLFSKKGEGGEAGETAHHAQVAVAFSAAVQLLEAGMEEGKDLEAELRDRAQKLNDLADLVKASKKSN